MNPQHRPHGPQVAADGSTAPDPVGDQGAVPGGAQRSSEGRETISLRDLIAAALMPPSGAFVMAGIEAQADAVMAVVQPELDQLIEIQVIDLQVAASIAQHEQQRAEQAEAERDKVQADLEAYTTDMLSVLAKKNTALEKAVAAIERVRALHQPMARGGLTICAHCAGWNGSRCRGMVQPHPCPTIAALDQPDGDT